MLITTEGLLLQAKSYLGKKKILKVFTPDYGMRTFFTSKDSPPPFCIGEWTFKNQDKEMQSLLSSSTIDSLNHLKTTYETICAAGQMAKILIDTQLSHKESCDLYRLSKVYFQKLFLNPELLLSSFRLKILIHEGVFSGSKEEFFSQEEWEKIESLAFSKSLDWMMRLEGVPYEKIEKLYEIQIR